MKLPKFLDEYALRARLFPALVAGAAAICAFFVLAPWDKMGLPQIAATLASGVLLFALADLARRQGKRIEPGLYEKWGGKPTTVMLRHSDSALDAATKARYLALLAAKIKAQCPSAADEQTKLAECDAFYERCGNWLRENTRDAKKFKILFDENVTYGFRRNLFALKYVALGIDTLVVGACAIAFSRGVPFDIEHATGAKFMFIGAFAIIHAGYILFTVTEQSVREAAQQYARQLLLCCETMANGALPKRGKEKA
jgi:uncharacterized protein (DUF1697 family)